MSKKIGIKFHNFLSNKGIECHNFIKQYNDGQSMSKLSEIYNIDIRTCKKILTLNNIEIRYRKYRMDEDYFNVIDNEHKAYWLGFVLADGNVDKYSNNLKLELKYTDGKHLEKFLDSINSNYDIKKRERINENGNLIKSRILVVSSKKIIEALNAMGIKSGKSFDVIPPLSYIPKKYLKDFWRGCFDGDGWISIGSKRNRIGLCGSYDTVKGFIQFIFNKLSIFGKIRKQDKIFRIDYERKLDVVSILDELYYNSSIHLDRKKLLYDQLER